MDTWIWILIAVVALVVIAAVVMMALKKKRQVVASGQCRSAPKLRSRNPSCASGMRRCRASRPRPLGCARRPTSSRRSPRRNGCASRSSRTSSTSGFGPLTGSTPTPDSRDGTPAADQQSRSFRVRRCCVLELAPGELRARVESPAFRTDSPGSGERGGSGDLRSAACLAVHQHRPPRSLPPSRCSRLCSAGPVGAAARRRSRTTRRTSRRRAARRRRSPGRWSSVAGSCASTAAGSEASSRRCTGGAPPSTTRDGPSTGRSRASQSGRPAAGPGVPRRPLRHRPIGQRACTCTADGRHVRDLGRPHVLGLGPLHAEPYKQLQLPAHADVLRHAAPPRPPAHLAHPAAARAETSWFLRRG